MCAELCALLPASALPYSVFACVYVYVPAGPVRAHVDAFNERRRRHHQVEYDSRAQRFARFRLLDCVACENSKCSRAVDFADASSVTTGRERKCATSEWIEYELLVE